MNTLPLDEQPSGTFSIQLAQRRHRRRIPTWQVMAGYGLAYLLLHLLAASLSGKGGAFVWFYPAGLSVALLLMLGPRALPAVILAPLPVNLFLHPMGLGLFSILGMSLAYGCGFTLAVLAFRRARFSPRLRRVQDVVGFLALAVLGPWIALSSGLGCLSYLGILPAGTFSTTLQTLLLASVLGIISFTPIILIWIRPMLALGTPLATGTPLRMRIQEGLLQGLALLLGTWLLVRFSDPALLHWRFLLFLPMAWVALRGGLRAVALALPWCGLSIALWSLAMPPHSQMEHGTQAFLMVLFGLSLILAATVDTRDAALRLGELRRRRLQQLGNCTGAIPWGMDLLTGESGFMGVRAETLLGRPRGDWQGQPFWGSVVHTQDQALFLRFLLNLSHPGQTDQVEFRLIDATGKDHWVRALGGLESSISPTWVMGFLFDIQAHKRAEEDALRATLKEKDLLLREIHHRVKNNLQVVSSLLRLQASTQTDATVQRVLKEAQDRVQAIALIHQKLKHSPDFTQVDLPAYVHTLADRLVRSYASVPALIDLHVHVEVEGVDIGPDAPVPLGLILNELLANALQHAFPQGEGGSLDIRLDRDERGWIQVRVSDSGHGLPEDVDLDKGGLGFQLVRALTDQLGGTLELERRKGASFLLCFPPPNPIP
jgi:two-component sensor histidine kinase/PAS domain-containing protein